METKKKFVLICPTCGNKEKIVYKCLHCWRWVCNECSINRVCLDCYMDLPGTKSYIEKRIGDALE